MITFDVDDIHAAFEELDNRYLLGEAAAYAGAWSVITASYAAINRHEQPTTTADWVDVDHRREIAMRPGDLAAYFETGSDPNQNIITYVEEVHRLNSFGAVLTYAAQETSQEGFNAEWRGAALLTVDGTGQSERNIRRGRPRRRAREVRSAQPARTPDGKRCESKPTSASRRTSRPATGTPWPKDWPTTFCATTAGDWWARKSERAATP